MIAETNPFFAKLDKSYYLEAMNKLKQGWTKCISQKKATLKMEVVCSEKLSSFFIFARNFQPTLV